MLKVKSLKFSQPSLVSEAVSTEVNKLLKNDYEFFPTVISGLLRAAEEGDFRMVDLYLQIIRNLLVNKIIKTSSVMAMEKTEGKTQVVIQGKAEKFDFLEVIRPVLTNNKRVILVSQIISSLSQEFESLRDYLVEEKEILEKIISCVGTLDIHILN